MTFTVISGQHIFKQLITDMPPVDLRYVVTGNCPCSYIADSVEMLPLACNKAPGIPAKLNLSQVHRHIGDKDQM